MSRLSHTSYGNLYTEADFCSYYGSEQYSFSWFTAAPWRFALTQNELWEMYHDEHRKRMDDKWVEEWEMRLSKEAIVATSQIASNLAN